MTDSNYDKTDKNADKNDVHNKDEKPNFYVGIGASAGGLEALEAFFRSMDSQSGLAFLIVQHLSPDYKSLMTELLSRYTDMEVNRAEDGMPVHKNCIYLIPPKKNMTINGGCLYLSEQDHDHKHGLKLPIDIFMRSLAKDQAEHAIGVILSGTGSDGTMGLRDIKGAGGVVMVQDEADAKFDGMPRSAIATGLVDYILPADALPEQLVKFTKHPFVLKSGSIEEQLRQDTDSLTKMLNVLREHIGIDFNYYKPNTVIRRVERRISINQIERLEDYVSFLGRSPKEAKILYKDLLIGVTQFFRDKDAYDALQEKVIPRIFENKPTALPIRVWSVGCATGEEAYTLAIIFKNYQEQNNLGHEIKVFATDLDGNALEFASNGIYPESIVADIPEALLTRYFKKMENSYQVNEDIRRMVIFAAHNIIKDPPFSKIDLICCRNMLIYLKPSIQKKVINAFLFSLDAKGFLFLGSSESLGDYKEMFETIDSKLKLFQTKGVSRPRILENMFSSEKSDQKPARSVGNVGNVSDVDSVRSGHEISTQPQVEDDLMLLAYQHVMERFVPPCLIVDANLNLMHICRDASPFIRIPAGKMTLNIVKLAHEELSAALSSAAHKALRQKEEITYRNFIFEDREDKYTIDIIVSPVNSRRYEKDFIVIVFNDKTKGRYASTDFKKAAPEKEGEGEKEGEEEGARKGTGEGAEFDAEDYYKHRIQELEQDLQYNKENLQATIEELETSNEELQATNEELVASNEELQSTNEELQSVNEELYTVNSEYQDKIEELTILNNDMDNLLRNTNVGLVFLDTDLRIRKFTPAITRIINLIDSDIGRPIDHFASKVIYDNLMKDIQAVVDDLQAREAEVQSSDQGWYQMRIIPYRTQENAVDGVVLTFVDVTERRNFEEQLEKERDLLNRIMENSPIGKTMVDKDGNIEFANKRAEEMLGLKRATISEMTYDDPKWKITDDNGNPIPSEDLPFARVKATQESLYGYHHWIEWPDGKRLRLLIHGSPVFNMNDEFSGVVFSLLTPDMESDSPCPES